MKEKISILLILTFIMVLTVNAQNENYIYRGKLKIVDTTLNQLIKEINKSCMIVFIDSTQIQVGFGVFIEESIDSYNDYPHFKAKILNKNEYLILTIPEQYNPYHEQNIQGLYQDSTGYLNHKKTEINFALRFHKDYILTYNGTINEIEKKQ